MPPKILTTMRLTAEERRAVKALAGLKGENVTEWTSKQIYDEWVKQFPGKAYPDENGFTATGKPPKPKKGR